MSADTLLLADPTPLGHVYTPPPKETTAMPKPTPIDPAHVDAINAVLANLSKAIADAAMALPEALHTAVEDLTKALHLTKEPEEVRVPAHLVAAARTWLKYEEDEGEARRRAREAANHLGRARIDTRDRRRRLVNLCNREGVLVTDAVEAARTARALDRARGGVIR